MPCGPVCSDRDGAAAGREQLAGNGQTDARAGARGAGRIGSVEALEDVGEVFRGDARAVVDDPDLDLLPGAAWR